MKKLLAFCVVIAACQFAVPEPAIEKARQICEPYGGLKEVSALRLDTLYFTCNNGDEHTLMPMPSAAEKSQ